MVEVPFPPEDPPDEPPSGSVAELFWRVAVRLFRDHFPRAESSAPPAHRCERCWQPWPCSGRRLALLGLLAAARTRRPPVRE